MEISFGELTLLKYSFGLIGYESKVGGRRVSGEALPKRLNARTQDQQLEATFKMCILLIK